MRDEAKQNRAHTTKITTADSMQGVNYKLIFEWKKCTFFLPDILRLWVREIFSSFKQFVAVVGAMRCQRLFFSGPYTLERIFAHELNAVAKRVHDTNRVSRFFYWLSCGSRVTKSTVLQIVVVAYCHVVRDSQITSAWRLQIHGNIQVVSCAKRYRSLFGYFCTQICGMSQACDVTPKM